jgi:hypothetical protein
LSRPERSTAREARDDYQRLMEAHLGDWRVRLETLRRQSVGDADVELQRKLDEWRAAGRAALSKLGELKAATGEGWEVSRLELEKLWLKIEMVLGSRLNVTTE